MPDEKKTTSTAKKATATKAAKKPAAKRSTSAKTTRTAPKKATAAAKAPAQAPEIPQNVGPASEKAAKQRARQLKKQNKRTHGTGFWVVLIIIALVVGGFCGKFFGGFVPLGTLTGKTLLTEGQLSSPVATYSYNGKTVSVSARDVLEYTTGVEDAKDGDNYTYPNSSAILEYVQNQVLNQKVAEEGITVSDEEMDQYAQDTLGSTDYTSLANQYGMTVDATKQVVRESAGVRKLYEQVTSQQSSDAVSAPEECPESERDIPSEKYGQYLTNLLGDEWNSSKETWASTSGTYYSELKDEKFSSTSATYNQAKKAYDIAAKNQSDDTKDAAKTWTDYVNKVMADAAIVIGEIL